MYSVMHRKCCTSGRCARRTSYLTSKGVQIKPDSRFSIYRIFIPRNPLDK